MEIKVSSPIEDFTFMGHSIKRTGFIDKPQQAKVREEINKNTTRPGGI